ncbi:MAG TPA: fibronectin type III domain-containing protein [Thermoplasmata archaeon]|nr:fibronectin type III domain-containing protein [Thermoplasmata archaeon]
MKKVCTILIMTTKRKKLILLAILALALVLGGCVALPPVPPPPSNLTATAVSSQQIDLTWKDNSRIEKGFYVYRRTIGGYGRIAALDPNTTSYSDSSLSLGTTYSYKVTAYNDGGESAPSNEINITTPLPEWYLLLRPEFRPTEERISRLETLRAKYEIPSEAFALCISSYPGTTRLLQINLYKQAKENWPDLSEKDLLKNIFVGRALKPEPSGYGMTPEEFEKVMEKINSLEELCDYVVSRDLEEPEYELDLSEWEKYVNMLKKLGIGTEIDWERHKRNVERIKRDSVKEKINAIMEEEAQKALAKVRQRIEVTCEQLGRVLLGFTIKISEDPLEGLDVSDISEEVKLRLSDEVVLLEMFAITYACQQEIINPEINQCVLDSYHKYLYDWMEHNGATQEQIESFEELLQKRYEGYYNAIRKDSEAHKTGNIPWYMGRTATEYVFGEFKDVFWAMHFSIIFGSTLKAARGLIREYEILANKGEHARIFE